MSSSVHPATSIPTSCPSGMYGSEGSNLPTNVPFMSGSELQVSDLLPTIIPTRSDGGRDLSTSYNLPTSDTNSSDGSRSPELPTNIPFRSDSAISNRDPELPTNILFRSDDGGSRGPEMHTNIPFRTDCGGSNRDPEIPTNIPFRSDSGGIRDPELPTNIPFRSNSGGSRDPDLPTNIPLRSDGGIYVSRSVALPTNIDGGSFGSGGSSRAPDYSLPPTNIIIASERGGQTFSQTNTVNKSESAKSSSSPSKIDDKSEIGYFESRASHFSSSKLATSSFPLNVYNQSEGGNAETRMSFFQYSDVNKSASAQSSSPTESNDYSETGYYESRVSNFPASSVENKVESVKSFSPAMIDNTGDSGNAETRVSFSPYANTDNKNELGKSSSPFKIDDKSETGYFESRVLHFPSSNIENKIESARSFSPTNSQNQSESAKSTSPTKIENKGDSVQSFSPINSDNKREMVQAFSPAKIENKSENKSEGDKFEDQAPFFFHPSTNTGSSASLGLSTNFPVDSGSCGGTSSITISTSAPPSERMDYCMDSRSGLDVANVVDDGGGGRVEDSGGGEVDSSGTGGDSCGTRGDSGGSVVDSEVVSGCNVQDGRGSRDDDGTKEVDRDSIIVDSGSKIVESGGSGDDSDVKNFDSDSSDDQDEESSDELARKGNKTVDADDREVTSGSDTDVDKRTGIGEADDGRAASDGDRIVDERRGVVVFGDDGDRIVGVDDGEATGDDEVEEADDGPAASDGDRVVDERRGVVVFGDDGDRIVGVDDGEATGDDDEVEEADDGRAVSDGGRIVDERRGVVVFGDDGDKIVGVDDGESTGDGDEVEDGEGTSDGDEIVGVDDGEATGDDEVEDSEDGEGAIDGGEIVGVDGDRVEDSEDSEAASDRIVGADDEVAASDGGRIVNADREIVIDDRVDVDRRADGDVEDVVRGSDRKVDEISGGEIVSDSETVDAHAEEVGESSGEGVAGESDRDMNESSGTEEPLEERGRVLDVGESEGESSSRNVAGDSEGDSGSDNDSEASENRREVISANNRVQDTVDRKVHKGSSDSSSDEDERSNRELVSDRVVDVRDGDLTTGDEEITGDSLRVVGDDGKETGDGVREVDDIDSKPRDNVDRETAGDNVYRETAGDNVDRETAGDEGAQVASSDGETNRSPYKMVIPVESDVADDIAEVASSGLKEGEELKDDISSETGVRDLQQDTSPSKFTGGSVMGSLETEIGSSEKDYIISDLDVECRKKRIDDKEEEVESNLGTCDSTKDTIESLEEEDSTSDDESNSSASDVEQNDSEGSRETSSGFERELGHTNISNLPSERSHDVPKEVPCLSEQDHDVQNRDDSSEFESELGSTNINKSPSEESHDVPKGDPCPSEKCHNVPWGVLCPSEQYPSVQNKVDGQVEGEKRALCVGSSSDPSIVEEKMKKEDTGMGNSEKLYMDIKGVFSKDQTRDSERYYPGGESQIDINSTKSNKHSEELCDSSHSTNVNLMVVGEKEESKDRYIIQTVPDNGQSKANSSSPAGNGNLECTRAGNSNLVYGTGNQDVPSLSISGVSLMNLAQCEAVQDTSTLSKSPPSTSTIHELSPTKSLPSTKTIHELSPSKSLPTTSTIHMISTSKSLPSTSTIHELSPTKSLHSTSTIHMLSPTKSLPSTSTIHELSPTKSLPSTSTIHELSPTKYLPSTTTIHMLSPTKSLPSTTTIHMLSPSKSQPCTSSIDTSPTSTHLACISSPLTPSSISPATTPTITTHILPTTLHLTAADSVLSYHQDDTDYKYGRESEQRNSSEEEDEPFSPNEKDDYSRLRCDMNMDKQMHRSQPSFTGDSDVKLDLDQENSKDGKDQSATQEHTSNIILRQTEKDQRTQEYAIDNTLRNTGEYQAIEELAQDSMLRNTEQVHNIKGKCDEVDQLKEENIDKVNKSFTNPSPAAMVENSLTATTTSKESPEILKTVEVCSVKERREEEDILNTTNSETLKEESGEETRKDIPASLDMESKTNDNSVKLESQISTPESLMKRVVDKVKIEEVKHSLSPSPISTKTAPVSTPLIISEDHTKSSKEQVLQITKENQGSKEVSLIIVAQHQKSSTNTSAELHGNKQKQPQETESDMNKNISQSANTLNTCVQERVGPLTSPHQEKLQVQSDLQDGQEQDELGICDRAPHLHSTTSHHAEVPETNVGSSVQQPSTGRIKVDGDDESRDSSVDSLHQTGYTRMTRNRLRSSKKSINLRPLKIDIDSDRHIISSEALDYLLDSPPTNDDDMTNDFLGWSLTEEDESGDGAVFKQDKNFEGFIEESDQDNSDHLNTLLNLKAQRRRVPSHRIRKKGDRDEPETLSITSPESVNHTVHTKRKKATGKKGWGRRKIAFTRTGGSEDASGETETSGNELLDEETKRASRNIKETIIENKQIEEKNSTESGDIRDETKTESEQIEEATIPTVRSKKEAKTNRLPEKKPKKKVQKVKPFSKGSSDKKRIVEKRKTRSSEVDKTDTEEETIPPLQASKQTNLKYKETNKIKPTGAKHKKMEKSTHTTPMYKEKEETTKSKDTEKIEKNKAEGRDPRGRKRKETKPPEVSVTSNQTESGGEKVNLGKVKKVAEGGTSRGAELRGKRKAEGEPSSTKKPRRQKPSEIEGLLTWAVSLGSSSGSKRRERTYRDRVDDQERTTKDSVEESEKLAGSKQQSEKSVRSKEDNIEKSLRSKEDGVEKSLRNKGEDNIGKSLRNKGEDNIGKSLRNKGEDNIGKSFRIKGEEGQKSLRNRGEDKARSSKEKEKLLKNNSKSKVNPQKEKSDDKTREEGEEEVRDREDHTGRCLRKRAESTGMNTSKDDQSDDNKPKPKRPRGRPRKYPVEDLKKKKGKKKRKPSSSEEEDDEDEDYYEKETITRREDTRGRRREVGQSSSQEGTEEELPDLTKVPLAKGGTVVSLRSGELVWWQDLSASGVTGAGQWWPGYVEQVYHSRRLAAVCPIGRHRHACPPRLDVERIKNFQAGFVPDFVDCNVRGLTLAVQLAEMFCQLRNHGNTITPHQFFSMPPEEQDSFFITCFTPKDDPQDKKRAAELEERERERERERSSRDKKRWRHDHDDDDDDDDDDSEEDREDSDEELTLSVRDRKKMQGAIRARRRENERLLKFMQSPACLKHLWQIFNAEQPCERHHLYQDEVSRRSILWSGIGPFQLDHSDDQILTVVDFLCTELLKKRPDFKLAHDYVFRVWMPEAIKESLRVIKKVPEGELEAALDEGYKETKIERKARRLNFT